MFAAAGIVVTLMETPTSEVDFAAVSETVPATPGEAGGADRTDSGRVQRRGPTLAG